MENEFARISIEEGFPGLLLWVAFALWILLVSPGHYRRFGGTVDLGIWAVCALMWAQGAIGTGVLTSVPGTMILLLYMGALGVQRRTGSILIPAGHEVWMRTGLRTTGSDA
jgi:hypothetical protein